jgi:AraC-like DNA-binding protein
VEGEDFSLSENEAIVIPAGKYHRLAPLENTQRISFQIDAPCRAARHKRLPLGVAEALFSAVKEAETDGDFAMLSSYMSLAATMLLGEQYEGTALCDYPLIIREFFSRRYSEEVHLSDLASELHLSERQAERLVEEYTGKSFRDELTGTRMAVADQLIAEGELSLAEIAAYVGYHSYAGFFKARKRKE